VNGDATTLDGGLDATIDAAPAEDARALPDFEPPPDVSTTDGLPPTRFDAGTSGTGSDAGCGCHSTNSRGSVSVGLMTLLLALARRRRRR
jgi:MYXO-CTERM domain-containing protein